MTATPDAEARSPVARAPAGWQPYLSLSRADRPVGFWLLALPCFMGQALGRIGEGFGLYDLLLAALWMVGAVAMRGAGCTFNDIIDRHIDAQVARTAARPIPAGTVSVRQAIVWMLAQCGVGLAVLLCLPPPAQIVALLAIPMVAAYPFMKRITWWPQVWLGLTFNWGVLVGFAAVEGAVTLPALLLFAACAAWTLGYDTIYALQDIEDDALVGVRSAARRMGQGVQAGVRASYRVALGLTLAALLVADPRQLGAVLAGLPALGVLAWHLERQAAAVRPGLEPGVALALFRSNRTSGLAWVAAIASVALAGWLASAAAGAPGPVSPPA